VEGRAADHIIADQNVGENLAPLDAENPSGNLSDRRILGVHFLSRSSSGQWEGGNKPENGQSRNEPYKNT